MICTFIFYGVVKHTYKLIVQEACNLHVRNRTCIPCCPVDQMCTQLFVSTFPVIYLNAVTTQQQIQLMHYEHGAYIWYLFNNRLFSVIRFT
jgi:hypothetical protein